MRGTYDSSVADDMVDILRERLAELENLEATEALVAVCWLLAELDRELHAGRTLH
jgi:hypothetical protein